jgi:hypothetical protein
VEWVQGNQVALQTVWLGEPRRVLADRWEVLPLKSGMVAASPVVYWLEDTRRIGSLVTLDQKHRWVLGAEGVIHRLPWNKVQAFDMSKVHRVGDQVLAALPVTLRLVSVIRVLDRGLRYEVGWAQTKRQVVSFAALAPPR